MRIGSLFSGAGGLDVAVQAVFGGKVVWHSEVDPAASKVLAHHYPDVPNLGDITRIDWSNGWALCDTPNPVGVEPVDVLCGGWPCQPFSLAGEQKGIHDERALWPHVARAIRALRPRIVVLENVPAVLTAGEFDRLAVDLASSGYEFRWICFRASDVGAPHRRERLFVVAYPAVEGLQRPQLRQDRHESAGERDREPVLEPPKFLATPQARDRRDEPKAGFCESSLPRDVLQLVNGWGEYEPAIRRWEVLTRPAPQPAEPSTTGKPRVRCEFSEWMMGWPEGWVTALPLSRTDKLKCIGNGVVPQQAIAALTYLLQFTKVAATAAW